MCDPRSAVCPMRVCSDGIDCMQTSSARASVAFARTVSHGASCGSGSRSKVRCWKTVRSTGSQARCAPLSTHAYVPHHAADRLIHVATWWQCARCQEAQELREAGYSGVVYADHAPIEPQQPVPSEPGSEPAPVSAQRARLAQAAERAVIADRPATSRPLLQEPLLGEPGPPVGST